MKAKIGVCVAVAVLVMAGPACSSATAGSGSDRNVLTAEDIAGANVSTLYEVVQRLRPRWLEVRSPRGLGTQTQVAVFLDRTYVGSPEELRSMGVDVAEWLEYRTGSQVAAELTVPGGMHVEGGIIVHTNPRR